ncbi:hypothetical protein BDQ12DRAFT_745592 [Crucibulum laeve]|uniref:Uncharacterized protein n=1 Tax=Crucibulum laeve TaxID=68775 RepID=A0A5C3M2I9_9AGAR|nr:hypothetical protein BDQ12DRAFT_745592 [Crucibulum laeve]
MDTNNFAPAFGVGNFGLFKKLHTHLLEEADAEEKIILEVYRLNVYGERKCRNQLTSLDSFFKPRKDTPRSEDIGHNASHRSYASARKRVSSESGWGVGV